MKESIKNIDKIYSTTVTANRTLVEKACGYTGCNSTATISLVTLACLHESNKRNLKHSSENYILLLPYEQRHDTKKYNIHGKECVNALKRLTQKLTSIDNSIDSASKAINHALVQFITAYEKENPLTSPIKLMGSKWDKDMQKVINRIMESCHYTSIVETCAGALGIFCNINTHGDVLLNDLDKGKISFYKALQNNCTKLLIDFMLIPRSKKNYEHFEEILKNSDHTDYQTAITFLYVNFYDTHYFKHNYWTNATDISLAKVCKYLRISRKLKGVKFNTLNLLNLIPKYRKDSDTLLICDPPYEDTKSYESNLTNAEHVRLAKMLEHHSGQFIYFCRISACGKNSAHDTKIVTARVEDNYANKGFYYVDVPLSDNRVERIITNFDFDGATEFTIPMNTDKKGGDSDEK